MLLHYSTLCTCCIKPAMHSNYRLFFIRLYVYYINFIIFLNAAPCFFLYVVVSY